MSADEGSGELRVDAQDGIPGRTVVREANTPDTIVGLESGLRGVRDMIASVAPGNTPVLLLGETGSGKELAARMIHRSSPRGEGPMVRVNCGAIPPGLIDSELFGHERGAFTGALQQRRGWFERAHRGTLFLDEIAELSLDAQVRLLRVLQEGTLQRVGSDQTLTVDVRLVAATHRDLAGMVQAGTFREDLWYRLCVFPIQIPPLRTRTQDIEALARHFARAAGERLFSRPLEPTAADVAVLRTYSWPGNVRELAAVIERAAILGRGRGLAVTTALGAAPLGEQWDLTRPPPPDETLLADGEGFPTLETVVRRHIERALLRAAGRIEGVGGAADLLDINPHTLRARMRKMGLDWNVFRGVG